MVINPYNRNVERIHNLTERLTRQNRRLVLDAVQALSLIHILDVVVWSENCDGQANAMIQRRKLCSVHNFRRCLWWL